jgi:PAS domain S-box-containing protein
MDIIENNIQISRRNSNGIILIIDDNISNIKFIVNHLNHHHFETIIARNGKTGLERARFSQPDLILLDVLMPEMDGFETCRHLKTDNATKDIPVLFMTVLNETSDKLKGFQAGAVDYVSKPIQEEEILARILTHVKLRKLQKSMEIKNEKLQGQAVLMDQIKDSIISTDLNGNITYVNQSAAKFLLRERDELIGKSVHILGENSERGATQNEIIEQTLRTGNWQGRVANIDKNNNEHIFETRTWITTDKNGNQTGIVGVSTDITDQARMQEDLKKAKEVAEAANRAKTTFLANMSHELKTPLNAIIGFSRSMAKDHQLSLQYRKDLESIHHSGKHLFVLINDLLEISKVESNTVKLSEKICNIHSLIHEIKGMFRLKAKEKELQLNVHVSPDLPEFILVDENKFRQILINLLSNAITFTETGAVRCRIFLDNNTDKKTNADNQCMIYVEIEDTGIGIASDQLDNLFKPFVQLSSGENFKQGTGLGLSISRKYVQLMGGEIGVKSKPGQGSLFWFKICVKRADPEKTDTIQANNDTKQEEQNIPHKSGQPDSDINLCVNESNQRQSHEAIARLPLDLINELKQAASSYDPNHIYEIIEQIRKIDAAIADVLEHYVYNFEYNKILEIV